MDIPHVEHALENGLRVVLHPDESAPVVSVYVYYHVGSAREDPQRSGFAHLFEHMLFQGSQHVGEGEHFRRIQEAGGTLNGTTSQDRTNYYETLPANELELALWLEADRMGFLLPAMTQEKLDNQRDVVKNERRQSYENRPYGLVYETVLGALYPSGHPYSWPTIGSMEHIDAASLEDVGRFFRRWYGPNNATLAIGGAFEPGRALEAVERWFGSIPRGPAVDAPGPLPIALEETRRAVLEDRVALPQLTLTWPTVHHHHPDEPALTLLTDVLSADRSSVLDRALTIDEELASAVTIAHWAQELTGTLTIQLRPHEGVTLETLERRVDEELEGIVERGVDERRLSTFKNRREGAWTRALEAVSVRTDLLARHACFFGDPGRFAADLERYRRVTPDDLRRVAREYVVGRPRVALSCVPEGRRELAAEVAGAGPPVARKTTEPDRRSGPQPGPPPGFQGPVVWTARAGAGVELRGTPYTKLPLRRFSLTVDAGRTAEASREAGVSSLAAEMLEEGTLRLSNVELVEELNLLGATFRAEADDDVLVLRMACLEEHLEAGTALLTEIALEPRFDEGDFERLRRERRVELLTRNDRISELADDAFVARVHGSGSPLSRPARGTLESVERLSLEHVVGFWRPAEARPARVAFAGAEEAGEVTRLFGPLAERWGAGAADAPRAPEAPPEEPTAIYLLDKPGAPQSELRVGHLGVPVGHPDFFPLAALNHVLGGAFTSRINLNLREDKGYTYGAKSSFRGGRDAGEFVVSTAVRTDDTAPALREVLMELERIGDGVTEDEVEFARRSLSLTLSRAYESIAARLALLERIATFGHPPDYPARRLAWLAGMGRADLDELARRHVRPDALACVVVGDAERVRPDLEALGRGPVRLLPA